MTAMTLGPALDSTSARAAVRTRNNRAPGASKAARRPVRLTRRGRLVVLLALVTLLVVAFSLGRVGSQAAPKGAAATSLGHTVVQPGETLWAVAERVAPGHDPRAVVDQIADLNDLHGRGLQPGQLLLIPRS